MTTINRRRKYRAMGSMAELRKERQKLSRQIRNKEAKLKQDLQEARDMFSLSNITSNIVDRLANVSPLLSSIMLGYRAVRTFIGRMRSHKHADCDCGCDADE